MLLSAYSASASVTDKFNHDKNQIYLLASGLYGEAGGVLTELKKLERDKKILSDYEEKLTEEIGDFLWYFVRISALECPEILEELSFDSKKLCSVQQNSIHIFLEFGFEVAKVVKGINDRDNTKVKSNLIKIFGLLNEIASISKISLSKAASSNIEKTFSRWPLEKKYSDLFDDDFPEEDQLPRRITIEFKQTKTHPNPVVLLRSNGLNIGDRITDNIGEKDGYRFHDIFHFSYMVHLGWSPISRSLLKCKRKSNPEVDEAEDGARAGIIEEAISAMVFSNAKKHSYFENSSIVEYNLLKTIKTMVVGYEVHKVPLWQWEEAIIDGFKIFRLLKSKGGGLVTLDLKKRKINFE